MNNYQAQQINATIAFATSIMALGFVVSIVSMVSPFSSERPKRYWLVYVTPEGKWGAWDITPYKPTLALHREDPKKYLKEWGEYYYLDAEAQVERGRFARYWISEATTRYKAIRNVQAMALPEHHSSPQLWIGVWYDTPANGRRIESAPGLLEYAGSIIQELIQKYGTAPVDLGFAEIEKEVLAVYVDHSIVLQPIVSEAWVADRETTKKVLRYVVSHEFGHYMAEFVLTEEEKKIRGEEFADALAKRETSMTREEVNKMTDVLGRKILVKLRIE